MASHGMQNQKRKKGEYAPKPGETRLAAATRELRAANARLVNCGTPASWAAHERAREEYLEAKREATI